jgi:hypothetical protein
LVNRADSERREQSAFAIGKPFRRDNVRNAFVTRTFFVNILNIFEIVFERVEFSGKRAVSVLQLEINNSFLSTGQKRIDI